MLLFLVYWHRNNEIFGRHDILYNCSLILFFYIHKSIILLSIFDWYLVYLVYVQVSQTIHSYPQCQSTLAFCTNSSHGYKNFNVAVSIQGDAFGKYIESSPPHSTTKGTPNHNWGYVFDSEIQVTGMKRTHVRGTPQPALPHCTTLKVELLLHKTFAGLQWWNPCIP